MSLQSEVTRLQGIKTNIRTALVNKGVSGAGSHNMADFATDIAGITTGTDVSDTTATASDVLSGKDFYLANGTKTSGAITSKSSSDLTASGATITAPAGYYPSSASKSVASGALSTPTISSGGLITSSVGTSGYLASGTSKTLQLSTQSAKTVTPTTSVQTVVAGGKYTTGAINVAGDSNLISNNIRSGKSIFGVSGSMTEGYKRVAIQSITYSGRTMYINASGIPAGIYMSDIVMVGAWSCNIIDRGTNYYNNYTYLIFSGAPSNYYLQNLFWLDGYNEYGGVSVMSFDSIVWNNDQIAVTLNQYCTIAGGFTASNMASERAIYYR